MIVCSHTNIMTDLKALSLHNKYYKYLKSHFSKSLENRC